MDRDRRDTTGRKDDADRTLADLGSVIRRKEWAEADRLEPSFIDALRRHLVDGDGGDSETGAPSPDADD